MSVFVRGVCVYVCVTYYVSSRIVEERWSANEKLYVCEKDVGTCIRERGVCVCVCHILCVITRYVREMECK